MNIFILTLSHGVLLRYADGRTANLTYTRPAVAQHTKPANETSVGNEARSVTKTKTRTLRIQPDRTRKRLPMWLTDRRSS